MIYASHISFRTKIGRVVTIEFEISENDVRKEPDFQEFLDFVNRKKHRYDGIPFPRWDRAYRAWREFGIKREQISDRRDYYRSVYLKSDHWKDLRARKLARHKICEVCGRMGKLDVHHVSYRELYDVVETDLVAVCRRCHDEIHEGGKLTGLRGWALEAFLRTRLKSLLREREPERMANQKKLGRVFAELRKSGKLPPKPRRRFTSLDSSAPLS